MKFTDFKIKLAEAQMVANKYFGPHEKSGPKYMEQIRQAISSGSSPLEVKDDNKDDRKVIFPTKELKKLALDAVATHIETMKTAPKGAKAPTIEGKDAETGETVKFQLDKIYKNLPTADGEGKVSVSVNMGNVTEGVVGLAFATRFKNVDRKVTAEQIINTGKMFFSKEQSTVNLQIEERTEDILELKITLPENDLKALRIFIESDGNAQEVQDKLGITDDGRKKLEKMISQCVDVANDSNTAGGAITKMKEFYADGIKQKLQVYSDGAEAANQSATKVDLSLIVAEGDGDKVIDTLSLISLKAGGGTSQIGQASGYAYDAMRRFWLYSFNYKLPSSIESEFETVMKKYGSYKPSKKDPEKITFTFNSPSDQVKGLKEIVNGPVKNAYTFASEKINKHIQGDREEGEEEFLYHLQKGLLFHSSKVEDKEDKKSFVQGNEDVVVLILNPGGGKNFVELKFGKQLANMLQYFDFTSSGVQSADGGNGVYLRIEANLKTDLEDIPEKIQKLAMPGKGSFLVQYRSAIKGNALRNTVEIGTQSKVLANVENFLIANPGDSVTSASGNRMIAGVDGKPTVNSVNSPKAGEMRDKIKKLANDPNAKVEEALMSPSKEFGPNYDIVDDLHIYMRNDPIMYRKSYFPMLCNMQKAVESGKKISVKELMMPCIRECGNSYNKKYGLAENFDEMMTLEQARDLARKIYDEEMPLIKKGAYK